LPDDYFSGAEIDRIDNDGNYEPGNVRWVTKKDNCINRGATVFIEFNGKRQCLTEWAAEVGMTISALRERLDRWTVEQALTLPKGTRLYNRWDGHKKKPKKPTRKPKLYEYQEKNYTMKELEKLSGIPSKLLRKRINERGWAVERAVTTKV
jgi:hypothetical protein